MASPLTKPPAAQQNPAFEEYRKTMLNTAGERYTGRGTRMRRGEMAGMDQGQAEEFIRSSYAKSVAADDAKASGKSSLAAEFSTPALDKMSGAVTKKMEDRANMRDVTTGREQKAMDDAKQEQWDAMTAPARAEAETGMGADPGDTMNPVDQLDNTQPSPLAKPGEKRTEINAGKQAIAAFTPTPSAPTNGQAAAKADDSAVTVDPKPDWATGGGGNDVIKGGNDANFLPSPVTKPTGSAAVFQKFKSDFERRKAVSPPARDLALETKQNNARDREERMGKANEAKRQENAKRWEPLDKKLAMIKDGGDTEMKAAQAKVDASKAAVGRAKWIGAGYQKPTEQQAASPVTRPQKATPGQPAMEWDTESKSYVALGSKKPKASPLKPSFANS